MHTRRIAVVALLIFTTNIISAQTTAQNRKDTIVLSVYNTNQRFMLYPTPFGASIGKTKLLTDLVPVYDTVMVKKQVSKIDTSSKKRGMVSSFEMSTERSCDKIEGDVRGKVAIIQQNVGCDISKQMYLAQKAGAKAVIIVHTTNSKDTVWLDSKKEYAYAKQITIPCYTVRNEMGTKFSQMLPSLVGIARKDTSTIPIQTLRQQTDSTVAAESAKYNQGISFDKTGWELAPNPSDDEVTIFYNFTEKQNATLQISNTNGDVLNLQKREGVQSGTFTIDVSSFPVGVYNAQLQHGRFIETKRLLVAR